MSDCPRSKVNNMQPCACWVRRMMMMMMGMRRRRRSPRVLGEEEE